MTATMAAIPIPSPEPLFRCLIGFEVSQVFMTAHRLNIFRELLGGPAEPATLIERLELSNAGGRRLMEACVSLGLLENRKGVLANSAPVQTYLDPASPCYIGGLVDYYQDDIYGACARLKEAVRDGQPQVEGLHAQEDIFSAAKQQAPLAARFLDAMHSLGLLEGRQLSELYPFHQHRRLLDVGGGSGALSIAIAARHTPLHADVFDQPWMCRIATQHIERAGLTDRVRTVEGDFWKDPLPQGADAILLSMVLHDWSAEDGIRLLTRCAATLPAGGKLLIFEQLLNEDRFGPTTTSLTNLMMLLRTRAGSEYTESEYCAMLRAAGLVPGEIYRTKGLRHLITATKP